MLGNHKHETLETQANERHDNNFRLFWSAFCSLGRAAYTNEIIFIVFVVFKQRTTF